MKPDVGLKENRKLPRIELKKLENIQPNQNQPLLPNRPGRPVP
jgi:hypothetical protein